MNTKQISFRTKTLTKPKSDSLSQQFVRIEKVLTEYEKKKFHPKIENFHYMSSHNINKNAQKKKLMLKKDKEPHSTEKLFGPLPQAFHQPKSYLKTQKSYDISQITLASSEEKQTYVKMSKIRNPQKRRKLKEAYPKYSEKYLATINKKFIQLFGKQVEYVNPTSPRETLDNEEKQFAEFHKQRNIVETKKQDYGEPSCKKYAQIQIDEFLEENTNLTMSQKRRINAHNKRNQYPEQLSPSHSVVKRRGIIYTKQRNLSTINDASNSTNKLKTMIPGFDSRLFEEEPIEFSSKGWLITHHNDSNIITI